jgi:serine/threonine protein kinase
MAELYLARSVGIAGFERHVVLKRIMAEHARNHRFVTMFLDEARLAAQLHHPNIAQVYDIGRVGESYFFTMEYVHGENVRDLLQRVAALKRQIPIEVTLTIIAGAAAGLHYAHDKRGLDRAPLGIVHRDISPSNLMVAYQGVVKLVDFGIAKASHRMTETRSGAVKGKVAYMSPEQCTGHPLDRRSDLFSLGIVLYEMVTMTRLYKYGTDFETMTHIVNHPPPPPSSRRPDVPRELEQIILKALAKRADDRYQSAGELLEAIEQFASRARLALSPMGLARYVRELFGERPEPWYELEAAGEHTGIVTIETAAVDPGTATPDPFGINSTHKTWAAPRPTLAGEWGPESGEIARIAAQALPTAPLAAPPAPPPPPRVSALYAAAVPPHSTLSGLAPPPTPVRPSIRLDAVPPASAEEPGERAGTVVGAPSTAPWWSPMPGASARRLMLGCSSTATLSIARRRAGPRPIAIRRGASRARRRGAGPARPPTTVRRGAVGPGPGSRWWPRWPAEPWPSSWPAVAAAVPPRRRPSRRRSARLAPPSSPRSCLPPSPRSSLPLRRLSSPPSSPCHRRRASRRRASRRRRTSPRRRAIRCRPAIRRPVCLRTSRHLPRSPSPSLARRPRPSRAARRPPSRR